MISSFLYKVKRSIAYNVETEIACDCSVDGGFSAVYVSYLSCIDYDSFYTDSDYLD